MSITRLANQNETPTSSREWPTGRTVDLVESHRGRVLEVGSSYWGDGDSAYYAVVLRDDGGHEQVGYCSTYCPGAYGLCEAVVDAPEAALEAYLEEKRRRSETHALISGGTHRDAVWHTPAKGAFVRVVAGRKVPIGLEGRVFWVGESRFGLRVGISPSDGADGVFTAVQNLEVLEQPELGADPCGRVYELPNPLLPGANRPEPAAPQEIPLPAERPNFALTEITILSAGEEPTRYWGWAAVPYSDYPSRNGEPTRWLALHLQGQSNWTVVRASARAYAVRNGQALLAWLTRRSALPEPDYRQAPIPAFCDPRGDRGARFLVETAHAAVSSPDGVSVDLPADARAA